MRNIRNIFSVACGYVAAVIGAGFASGQEIVSFFLKYGKCSIIGIMLACIMFSAFAYVVLRVCVERRIHSYSDFLNTILGSRMKKFTECMTLIFAMASLCVMTACAGEMGMQLFGMEKVTGALIFTLICGAIMLLGNKKIMGVNSILGAVIVFGIIFCCLYILRFREHQAFVNQTKMVVSGISYAGYNLLTAGVILSGMSRFLEDKKDAALAAGVAGAVFFILITLIWGVLGIYYGKVNLGEIPMLTMTFRQNNVLGGLYGVMLFFAVLTTAISSGFGVLDIAEKKIGRNPSMVFMLIVGFCFSGAGFSKLINTAYRFCGYVGIVFVFFVFYSFLKKVNKVVKERK